MFVAVRYGYGVNNCKVLIIWSIITEAEVFPSGHSNNPTTAQPCPTLPSSPLLEKKHFHLLPTPHTLRSVTPRHSSIIPTITKTTQSRVWNAIYLSMTPPPYGPDDFFPLFFRKESKPKHKLIKAISSNNSDKGASTTISQVWHRKASKEAKPRGRSEARPSRSCW